MPKFNNLPELITASILIVVLIAFLRVPKLLMPMSVHTSLGVILAAVFLLFVALVWKENGSDERDRLHILQAGRISFLVGCGILVTGILWQLPAQQIDPWLIIALIAMLLTKIGSRIISQYRH